MKRRPIDVDGITTFGAAVSRAANLSAGLVAAGSRPDSGVARACRWAWAVLSLAGIVDIARTRRFRRGWIVADAALCVATNLSDASWDGDSSPEKLHYHQMFALAVTAASTAGFAPVAVGSVLAACVSWSIALARLRRRRPEYQVPIVAASIEPLLTAGAIAVVTRGLRAMEADLAALRDKERHDAEIAATENERDRQHRLLHDTALQTLEAVAGDWHADEASLRALAAADAEQLRHALDDTATTGDLESALADLVDTYRGAGLDVTFEARDIAGWSGPAAGVLTAAAREAVVNALKHAGGGTTRVVAAATGAEVTVTVTDDGVGFDPTTTPPGFGIEHSIRRRVGSAGGCAEVESAPGRGTVVRMSVPRR